MFWRYQHKYSHNEKNEQSKRQTAHYWKEGFEPPMPAPKTRALTAWRLPTTEMTVYHIPKFVQRIAIIPFFLFPGELLCFLRVICIHYHLLQMISEVAADWMGYILEFPLANCLLGMAMKSPSLPSIILILCTTN